MQNKHLNILFEDAQMVCNRIESSSLNGKSVLITGASGLIGINIIACLHHLQTCGYKMKVYAHVFSEPSPDLSSLLSINGFHLIKSDLSDFNAFDKLPHADFIIHSAGYAQPSLFMANPVATILINTSATATLLMKLKNYGRFLFVSSSEIYSGLEKPLLQESDIGTTTPSHARSSYIEGKRVGEAICNAFRSKGIDTKIARVSLAYGPGTRINDKRAMNAFIEMALCKGKIELLDKGQAVRTYCYVTDTVELLLKILLHGKDHVYNVGGHSRVTIVNLAKIIGDIIDVPIIIPDIFNEMAGAPKVVTVDLSKIESEFSKDDYVPLVEGLSRTITWQKGLYS